MKTIFDKIYVISLTTNHSRQKFIKEQFNNLNIDFEFIYGTDFYNIRRDYKGSVINWPETFVGDNRISGSFGCSITHYQAVLQAYEFGYNNVLIIEDDICFIKNKQLIEYYLNNIPKDADFISWDPRFVYENEYNIIFNQIKNTNNYWIELQDDINYLIGGMMYGLMNRDIMKLYLDNQRKMFNISDSVLGIWRFPKENIKRYIASKCLCTDQLNIQNKFNLNGVIYDNTVKLIYNNIYQKIDKTITIDSFFKPNEYLAFTRYK